MRFAVAVAALTVLVVPAKLTAQEISVERGKLVSIIGNCHGCHTEGYLTSEGEIDAAKALRGNRIGWQGPWGTTYAGDLRLRAASLGEDGFVSYLKTLRVLPPMPWYAVRQLPESDMRSLYRYIVSLGDPGEKRDDFTPADVPPGEEPRTPFVVLDPPQMPKPCTRDLDCGVGEVCGAGEVRQCVPK